MNQVICFENQGVIDVRSMKTFGVSVKESTNPIGYFGTGLKYAIAIFLRHGQKIVVHAGDQVFDFDKKKVEIRGKEFEIITMNGEELPFTTELGKNWHLWQAFREIYCNCIDEKGSVSLIDLDVAVMDFGSNKSNQTRIFIKGAESILSYHDRDSIVLKAPSHQRIGEGKVEVFNRPSDYLYYRNVRVMKLKPASLLTYNIIEEMELTEDRTIKNYGLAVTKILGSIAKLTNTEVIKKVITSRESFESELQFEALEYWNHEISKEFEDAVEKEFMLNNDKLNVSARMWLKSKKNKESTKSYEPVKMNEVEEKQLQRCLDICHKSLRNFKVYDILIVKTLGDSTMAIAEIDQERMVISKKAFALGTKFLLSTIIEEFSHISTGYYDCTIQLQTHLFDLICTVIEDHVINEPV